MCRLALGSPPLSRAKRPLRSGASPGEHSGRGTERRGKRGAIHTWTEQHRDEEVRPFFLEVPRSPPLLVQPERGVLLACPLETKTIAWDERVREARLRSGATVTVSGTLVPGAAGDGYRDAAEGSLLSVPKGSLLSTAPLASHHRRWARFYGGWALALLLSTLASHALFFGAFYDVALNGQPCTAEITALDHPGAGRWASPRYVVDAVTRCGVMELGTSLEAEVSGSTFEGLRVGDSVPSLVVPGRPHHAVLGASPSVDGRWLGALILGAALSMFAFALHGRSRREPWERRPLVEWGRGHL